tara:strand:- start:1130 stop:2758 length:1629 start_codon:yes stop_codon:yes gene_type:complete
MATKKILIQIQVGAKDAAVAVSKVEKSLQGLSNAQMKVVDSTKKARTQTGLNNAILLETGRLASDLNFGFTAIANNLGQLVTLFASFVETNKGVIASFQALAKSLFGIGGILIGVQLLIAFGPRILDMLTGTTQAMKDLKKAQEDAAKAAGEQVGKLEALVFILDSAKSSAFEKQQAVDELNRSHKKLNIELDKEGKLTNDSRKAIEEYIPMLKQKAKAQAIVSLIQKKYGELIEIETQSLMDNLSVIQQIQLGFKKFIGFDNAIIDALNKARENRKKAISEIQEEINNLLGILDNLDTSGFEMNMQKIVESISRAGRTMSLDISFKEMLDKTDKELDEFGDRFTKFMKALTKVESIETKTRMDIQKRYAESLGILGQSFKNLGFMSDELKIAGIIAEKAEQIAKVIISTKASNLGITVASNAAAALNPIAAPIIKANARALKTDNNISAGVNIAAIVAAAATGIRGIKSKSATTSAISSDAGGDVNIQAPDFNVVGASETSQLATSLAGVTGRPIQAFVVGKQVTTQQELDRNITTTARIN